MSGRSDPTAGKRTLAADSSPFTLGEPAPNAKLFPVGEGIFKTIFTYDAATADLFGLTGGCSTLRKEQVGVNTKAIGVVLP